MPALHAYTGRFANNGHRFNPSGPLHTTQAPAQKARRNPLDWSSTTTRAARLFVGFKVGKKLTWKMNDLVKLVKKVRIEQVSSANSTYVAQRGIYTHRNGVVVDEPGAQVIIIDEAGTSAAAFEAQMISLGEVIAKKLKQESVVVELQENGVVKRVMGVTA